MHYFFDESGNWESIHLNKIDLILAGVAIPDENLELVKTEIYNLKSQNNLRSIHAADVNIDIKTKFKTLIAALLAKNIIKTYVKKCKTKTLCEKLNYFSSNEIFIESASQFILNLVFADKNPSLFWDFKFHYTYPDKVLEQMEIKKLMEKHRFDHPISLFEKHYSYSSPSAFMQRKKQILNQLNNAKYKKGRVAEFLNSKYSHETNMHSEPFKLYDLTLLELTVNENLKHRNIFTERINASYNKFAMELGIPPLNSGINLNYIAKENPENNFGIEIADTIANFFYTYKSRPYLNYSDDEKSILSLTSLINEEV